MVLSIVIGFNFHFSLIFESARTRVAFLSERDSMIGCGGGLDAVVEDLESEGDDASSGSSRDELCFTR